MLLAGLGRREEAVAERERARELDPLCLVVGTSAAWIQFMAGNYESAIDTCRNVLDMKPHFPPAARVLGASLLQMGRGAEGIVGMEAAAANAAGNPGPRRGLPTPKRCAVNAASRARFSTPSIIYVRTASCRRCYVALAHVGLGEAGCSLRAAGSKRAKSAIRCSSCLPGDPRFDPIRSDVRFARLLVRLRL